MAGLVSQSSPGNLAGYRRRMVQVQHSPLLVVPSRVTLVDSRVFLLH